MTTDSLQVTLGQLEVTPDPQHNLHQIGELAGRSAAAGARLLVLPEGIIARDPDDAQFVSSQAQPLDGPFVTELARLSQTTGVAIAGTVHTPGPRSGDGRCHNVHVVLDQGELIAEYTKIHLYDAFSSQESANVLAGDRIPPLVELDGFRLGLLTCYDVRFPDLSRAHAAAGADALLLPAAWVRGPLKEHHWQTLTTARALENTVYLLAAGEISSRNIGRSMVIDPLGVTIAAAGEQPTLLHARLDRHRIEQARQDLPVLANSRFAIPHLADTTEPDTTKELAS